MKVDMPLNKETKIISLTSPRHLTPYTEGRKMEQILLVYDLPKETITAIMMPYKNMKVKVCSLNEDTDFFDIIPCVLQGDTLAPYLFIICLDYVLRTSIERMKTVSSWQRKEAEDTLHKLLQTQTTLVALCF